MHTTCIPICIQHVYLHAYNMYTYMHTTCVPICIQHVYLYVFSVHKSICARVRACIRVCMYTKTYPFCMSSQGVNPYPKCEEEKYGYGRVARWNKVRLCQSYKQIYVLCTIYIVCVLYTLFTIYIVYYIHCWHLCAMYYIHCL